MDHAPEKSPCRQNHSAGAESASVLGHHTGDSAFFDNKIIHAAFNDCQPPLGFNRGLHGLSVEFAVCLRSRAAHSRSLAPVEKAELDPCRISHTAHKPVQRINLAHKMTLAQTADSGITGHLADRVITMGDEQRRAPRACRRCRSFATGMTAANHNHIELRMNQFRLANPFRGDIGRSSKLNRPKRSKTFQSIFSFRFT